MTYKFSSIYFFVPLIISTMTIREFFFTFDGEPIFPECQQTIEVTNIQKKNSYRYETGTKIDLS